MKEARLWVPQERLGVSPAEGGAIGSSRASRVAAQRPQGLGPPECGVSGLQDFRVKGQKPGPVRPVSCCKARMRLQRQLLFLSWGL